MVIGTVKTDGVHADGTPGFIEVLSTLLEAQEGGLTLEAPAIEWTSTQLVQHSEVPIEVLAWAHSCHTLNFACGRCRGCRKHFATMEELGIGPY
jgi:7-cyano-7-deazaguanine synthase